MSKNMPKKSKGRRPKFVKLSDPKHKVSESDQKDLVKASSPYGLRVRAAIAHVKGSMEEVVVKGDEKKGLKAEVKLVAQPSILATAKGLFNATTTYEFRLWETNLQVFTSAGTTAAYLAASLPPTVINCAEWAGILDALFDEYRIDRMIAHFWVAGQAFNPGAFTIDAPVVMCNDYNSAAAPGSEEIVLAHAESAHWHTSGTLISGSVAGPTGNNWCPKNNFEWHWVPPKFVEISSTTIPASAEWLPVSINFPGAIMLATYAQTAVTGDSPIWANVEYHVRMRMRR